MIDDWYDAWQVNLMGQIWVLRQFLPAMVKMDRGSIIFMWVLMTPSGVLLIMIQHCRCGLPGHAGAPNMWVKWNSFHPSLKSSYTRLPYSASKFAIRGAMESLYVELRQNYPGNQLHLMLVSPFIVETGEQKSPKVEKMKILERYRFCLYFGGWNGSKLEKFTLHKIS